jgi:hypothetical protein
MSSPEKPKLKPDILTVLSGILGFCTIGEMLTPALAGDDELEVIHFKSAALDPLC